MSKNRLEMFIDSVLAISVTIMVLDTKVPYGTDWTILRPVVPVFISYALSFLFTGIYWFNHHNLLQTVKHVDTRIMLDKPGLLCGCRYPASRTRSGRRVCRAVVHRFNALSMASAAC